MPQVPYNPVPTADPIAGTGSRGLSINAPAGAFGEGTAEAIKGLGGVESHVGDELFQRALALKQLQNETEARDADAQYMIKAGELHADYSAKQGKDAVDAYPKYQKDLQEARARLRNGLSNPMAQKLYDASSLSTMGRTIFNGAGHAATQQKQWSLGSAMSQMDLDAKTVEDSPNDDVLFQSKLNRVQANADHIAQLKGFEEGGPEAQDLTLKATSQLWKQRIIGLSRTDPFQAGTLLEKSKTKLTQDDYLRVDNAVTASARAVGAAGIANKVYQQGAGDDTAPPRSLKDMEDDARKQAQALRPNDPIFADHAVKTLQGVYNQDKYARRQEDAENWQTVNGGIAGGVRDIRALRLDPKMAAAIDALPKDKQNAIPGMINRYNAARDKVDNEDNFYKLKGLANNDVEAFLNTDVTQFGLSLPQIDKLNNLRAQLTKQQNSDPRVFKAVNQLRGAIGTQMEALGIYKRTDANKDDYDHFTGTLQSALDAWQDTHKKPPTYKELTEQIAPEVLRERSVPGRFWGTNQVPTFKMEAPSEWKERIKQDILNRGGDEPTDSQLDRAFSRTQFIQLYGGTPKADKIPK